MQHPALAPHAAARRYERLSEAAARRASPRLRLRPLALADAPPLWQATRHPDFNTWLTWPQPATPEDLSDRVARLVAQHRRHEACLLSALDRATGRWVGLYRIAPDLWRADQGWFELGMWVHPAYWGSAGGGGWAAELHAQGTALAFEASDAPGLSARTAKENIRGWKTLERMGFVRDGECEIAVEGRAPNPGWVYRLARQAWEREMAPGAAA
jgi:RimJ/RimL family protein N-acetyltransferase